MVIGVCAIAAPLSAGEEEAPTKLAIVPFVLPMASAEREWLSAGVPRVLALRLQQLPRLRVTVLPRPSTSGPGALQNPLEGAELSAFLEHLRPQGHDVVLFGTFHQVDTTLRLEIHLWATRPERHLGKIIEQSPEKDPDGLGMKLVTPVASALQLSASETERRRLEERFTTSAEAFERFSRALALAATSSDEEGTNRAVNLLAEAFNLDGKFSMALRQLADLHLRQGHYASAVEVYQSLLGLVKRDARVYRALGNAYMALGEANRALDAFKRGLQLDPRDPLLHLDLGLTHAALKDYENATKALLRALEFKPDDPLAFANLGVLYLLQGNFAAASATLRRAQLLHASDARLAYDLGLALMFEGAYDQARTQFERALQLKPDFAPAAYQLALVFERSDAKQAADGWKRYLELGRDKPGEEAWVMRAQEHLKRLQEP
jgi:Flp pilus assembly protein TadD/TolB-like protein